MLSFCDTAFLYNCELSLAKEDSSTVYIPQAIAKITLKIIPQERNHILNQIKE
jgi:hypothetical protein